MEFDELIKFIGEEDERLKKFYGERVDREKRILGRAVKVNEEIGELCDEILGYLSFQRKDKLDGRDETNLSKEFADVVITTLLLAKAVDVDIKKALEEKIKKIRERNY